MRMITDQEFEEMWDDAVTDKIIGHVIHAAFPFSGASAPEYKDHFSICTALEKPYAAWLDCWCRIVVLKWD